MQEEIKEEKVYNFFEWSPDQAYMCKIGGGGAGYASYSEVKESDLTAAQKDYLLGKIIHEFNELPKELRHKFFKIALEQQKTEIENKIWDGMDEDRKEAIRKLLS